MASTKTLDRKLEILLLENDLFLWSTFAVFCIQGDSLDISLLRSRPFRLLVRALKLPEIFPNNTALSRVELDILFSSEMFVPEQTSSTARARTGTAAVTPFSVQSLRFTEELGSPLYSPSSLFPSALKNAFTVQLPASHDPASSKDSASITDIVREPAMLLKAMLSPEALAKVSSAKPVAGNPWTDLFDPDAVDEIAINAVEEAQRHLVDGNDSDMWLSHSDPDDEIEEDDQFGEFVTPKPMKRFSSSLSRPNTVASAANVIANTTKQEERLKPAKAVDFAGFRRLLTRLAVLLHPNRSAEGALQWLLRHMKSKMQPRMDRGKAEVARMFREDAGVSAIFARLDDVFLEWYKFYSENTLMQGGMNLQQFMRCVTDLNWLCNGARSLSTYALAEIFMFASSKALDTAAEVKRNPRGTLTFEDFRETIVRVASAQFSRLAHPKTPMALKIKGLLNNIYIGSAGVNSSLGSSSQQSFNRRSAQPNSSSNCNISTAQRRFSQRVEAMQKADGGVNYLNWQPPPEPKVVIGRGAPRAPSSGIAGIVITPAAPSSPTSSEGVEATDMLKRQLSGRTSTLQRRMSITPVVAIDASAHGTDPLSVVSDFGSHTFDAPHAPPRMDRRKSLVQSMLSMSLDSLMPTAPPVENKPQASMPELFRARTRQSSDLVGEVESGWSGSLRSSKPTESLSATSAAAIERANILKRRNSISFSAPAGVDKNALNAVASTAAAKLAISLSVPASPRAVSPAKSERDSSASSPSATMPSPRMFRTRSMSVSSSGSSPGTRVTLLEVPKC